MPDAFESHRPGKKSQAPINNTFQSVMAIDLQPRSRMTEPAFNSNRTTPLHAFLATPTCARQELRRPAGKPLPQFSDDVSGPKNLMLLRYLQTYR